MRALAPLAVFLLVCACNGADDDTVDVDSAFACDCPEPSAAEVPYDNVSSMLTGTDVQAAVDELAARPDAPVDAFTRIIAVEQVREQDMAATRSETALCPGVVPDIGRALGGSCDTGGDADTLLLSTRLYDTGFECIWRYDGAGTVTLTARVTCLMPAEAQ